jgi:hypothetical protein
MVQHTTANIQATRYRHNTHNTPAKQPSQHKQTFTTPSQQQTTAAGSASLHWPLRCCPGLQLCGVHLPAHSPTPQFEVQSPPMCMMQQQLSAQDSCMCYPNAAAAASCRSPSTQQLASCADQQLNHCLKPRRSMSSSYCCCCCYERRTSSSQRVIF